MTLSYGFYNSVSQDRLYNAEHVSRIFDGIINDGVYASIGGYFLVVENTGMNVGISSGRAWFNHTWTYNDANIVLSLDTADPLLPRIDVVYLEVNSDVGVRANSVDILTGTPASTPVAPTLTNTSTVHQYPLAHVYVGATVTSISQAQITNKVGTTDCPFVTGLLSVITTNDLLAQWEDEFMAWFDEMKDQLTVDAAGNLQTQITNIKGNIDPPAITLLALKNHRHDITDGTPNIINTGLANAAVVAGKIAAGGLSATDQIANRIVTKDKVGIGVPYVSHRMGGSPTIWTTYGNVVRDVLTGVRTIFGTTQWTGVSSQFGLVTVSFGGSYFSSAPLVFPVSHNDQVNVSIYTSDVDEFVLSWRTWSSEYYIISLLFHWFATGPEA